MQYAKKVGSWIIEDITALDEYTQDGIGVPAELTLLADNYGRLLELPTPPGQNKAMWYARLTTLEDFANDAADTYDLNPMDATAKYVTVRKNTAPILSGLNSWLGTSFRLP